MAVSSLSSDDRRPDAVATPEGDGEFAADEKLAPVAVEAALEGLQTPGGAAPAKYDSDEHEPSLMERVIDEISHGTLLP